MGLPIGPHIPICPIPIGQFQPSVQFPVATPWWAYVIIANVAISIVSLCIDVRTCFKI